MLPYPDEEEASLQCILYSMYKNDKFILVWKSSKILPEIPEFKKKNNQKDARFW